MNDILSLRRNVPKHFRKNIAMECSALIQIQIPAVETIL